MPLMLEEHALDTDPGDVLDRVLRDDPDAARALAAARPGTHRLYLGIFNARPVAMLLLRREGDAFTVEWIVVHPATRGRGVATELLRLAGVRTPTLRCPQALAALARRAGLDGHS